MADNMGFASPDFPRNNQTRQNKKGMPPKSQGASRASKMILQTREKREKPQHSGQYEQLNN